MGALSEEFTSIEKGLRQAYPPMQPAPAFQEALYRRLMQSAALTERSTVHHRAAGVMRALVGVAALSAAGAAVVLLRGRSGAPLYPAALSNGLSAIRGH